MLRGMKLDLSNRFSGLAMFDNIYSCCKVTNSNLRHANLTPSTMGTQLNRGLAKVKN
jgi:hypothetical protein